MRIYIAYKYRYVENKTKLKSDLQQLSDFFSSLGFKPFILGRDVQKWENHKYSKVSTTLDILKNIGRHDVLFVYNTSEVHSNGLTVEMVLAKIFGLKIVYCRAKNVKKSMLVGLADYFVEFDSMDELKSKAKSILSSIQL